MFKQPYQGQANDLSLDMKNINADCEVSWTHRLRFTREVFSTSNPVFKDVIEPYNGVPTRMVVFIDKGVTQHTPDLVDHIKAYTTAHGHRINLVADPFEVTGGEEAKNNPEVVKDVAQIIHDSHLCRRSSVVAIGGGAVLDLVGFAAAIAHRGIRFIRLPSTTLAQDDAGVGVKNGINAFGKKNFLGTFAPPWAVINDINFLTTLDIRDWRSGFSEAIKVALVKDSVMFNLIEANVKKINARDIDAAETIIRQSAILHFNHIVSGGDPFELTEARPLDFGHWSAHKLEQMTNYEVKHGEAVAIGIAIDAIYSALNGWLSTSAAEKIINCLHALGFDLYHELMEDYGKLFEGLEEFREHLGGRMTLTMLRGIGQAFDVNEIDRKLMKKAISQLATIHQFPAYHEVEEYTSIKLSI